MAKTTGGGNLCQLFKLSSTWAVSTAIMAADTLNPHLTNQFSTAISGHEKTKNLQATLTHERYDENYTDFIKNYLWTEEVSEELYEDGVDSASSVSDPTSTVNPVGLAIIYSGISTNSKRLVRAFPFRLTGGGATYEAKKTIRPETVLVNVKAGATITIGTTVLNTTVASGGVSTAVTMTITAGNFGESVWMAAVSS